MCHRARCILVTDNLDVALLSPKIILPFAMLAGSSALALLMFASRPGTELAEATLTPPLIEVAEVVLEDINIPVQAQGTVTPHRETTLISEVAGRILNVSPSFNNGGFVPAGEVLVRIDESDYQANLLRAKAGVESAESALAQEKGRAEVALREWQKLSGNIKRSQDATDLYLRKPQLELAEAQLLSARADMQKALDDLERTQIRAPYDALIKAKRSDLGQYVSPGTPLADIFATDYAEVRLALPQSRISYLDLPGVRGYKDGRPLPMVDLYTDVGGELTHWQARLARTEGVVDERSRVLFVIARIEDPYALNVGDSKPLRIGSFVKANIVGRQFKDLVVLPRYVLRAGNQLWVVDKQSRLRNRKVGTLKTEGPQIFVTSGLQQGDLVSLTNITGAIPGTEVRVSKRTPTSAASEQELEAAGAAETQQPAASPDQSSTQTESVESAAPA